MINNTNCIFIQDTDFETFAEVRNVIKIGYTDDIWETFQEMFEERFEHDKRLLSRSLSSSLAGNTQINATLRQPTELVGDKD